MKFKKKIYYSLDLGLFLSGILLFLICKLDTKEVVIRGVIGAIMIASSYYALPFIDREKKDRYSMIFSWHFVAFVLAFLFAYFSLGVYVIIGLLVHYSWVFQHGRISQSCSQSSRQRYIQLST